MVLVLKEGATKEDISKIEKKFFQKKSKGGFDAKKYNGIMPFLEDALVIQKKMRDEWERNIAEF
ncbi:hypothetical protein [Mucilaginibacter psychrotolerans]|uniref:Uncharacterized protein n=1 Tax=Mucilaginibacter psychrotolerans TaxID=1524096 RepID=A0A4Y8S9L5_9SPHI|nr:hypothetical protein [Mucilaginibacter psychrotolerans]TFF35066.1 hypothetical protein E2R66_20195 [Mucilaginibacter psychrotolerans]